MKHQILFEDTIYPLQVAQIVLGCDHYGLQIPEEQAFRIMDTYYEQGGNFFDTARSYGQKETGGVSHSENTVGKWLKSRGVADKVVVSSKGALFDRTNKSVSRITETEIRRDLEASLESLQKDYLDIWFLHRDNPQVPVGEIVDMVSPLVGKGYVRHLGASNWSAQRLLQAEEYAQKHRKHGFHISQIQWSLAVSTPDSWGDPTIVCMNEQELAWYRERKLPVMAFSPQARGLFSKVIEQGVDAVSEKTRRYFLLEQNLERIHRCRELGRQMGMNPAGICLSYLTGAPFPVLPVIGCNGPQQLLDTLHHAEKELSEAQRNYLVGK